MNDAVELARSAARQVKKWLKELKSEYGRRWSITPSTDIDRAIESKILLHILSWPDTATFTWKEIKPHIQALLNAYYKPDEEPQKKYNVIEMRGAKILQVRGPLDRERALDFAQELAQEQTQSPERRLAASAKELEETGEWQNGLGYSVSVHEVETR